MLSQNISVIAVENTQKRPIIRESASVRRRLELSIGGGMATYQAIAATGKTILGVLRDARSAGQFEGFSFELLHTTDFQNPMVEGVGLYLYQVAPNTTRRNMSPRTDAEGQRFRPSLPVDLRYLLIPWAQKADTQQLLLTWSIRVLEDMSILPANV